MSIGQVGILKYFSVLTAPSDARQSGDLANGAVPPALPATLSANETRPRPDTR